MSSAIETRGEERKRKARESSRLRRLDPLFRDREREQTRERESRKREDPQLRQFSIERSRQSKKSRKILRAQMRIERGRQAEEAGVPLRVFEMDKEYQQLAERYHDWPKRLEKKEARRALADFRKRTEYENLRELSCAVCSGLRSKTHWRQINVKDIDLTLLKASEKLSEPSFEIDFFYGHPDIDNAGFNILLDRQGFIYPPSSSSMSRNPFDLRICDNCHLCLRQKRTPPLSLSSIWIGPTPACLQDLSIPEQLLISPGYLCVNIIQISNKRHKHHKLKGHVVTLPQNPSSLMKVLPLPIYRICEHLKVVFVGQGIPNERQLKKVFQVRKSKVTTALQWLIKHNILFKDIEISEENLESLPEGEVPEVIRMTTTVVDVDSRNTENYTGYLQDPNGEDEEEISSGDDEENGNIDIFEGTRELRSSGILEIDNVTMSERERVLRSLQEIINEINVPENISENIDNASYERELIDGRSNQPRIIRLPHSDKPMNEFNSIALFPAGFPVLFPYGCGGHIDSPHISLASYAKHLMRYSDPKFRQHKSFPFVIFDVLRRRDVLNQCRVMTKGSTFGRSAELISRLTLEDIKIAIEQEKTKQSINNPAILELFRNVNSVGSRLMASSQSRSRMRNEIRAITIRDGAPSLFMTINPADLHSPIVMMYAGKEIDVVNILAENPTEFPTATERSRLAHLDPCAVAKYFDVVIEGILATVVGYGIENGGTFGAIKNYYGVVEYQDRGTPHCHLLVWLHGVPDPQIMRRKLMEDESFCERLLEYVSEIEKEDLSYLFLEDEIITDEMLKEEYTRTKTIMEKRMHPSLFPIPDPYASNFEDQFRRDLIAIAKRTLYHSCTSSCKKYRRGSERGCRFDFPRELVEPPGIVFPEQGIIAVQRINAFINNHNPYVTAACRGNNDIKFISARKHALAYIHYITDYITKSDARTHSSFLLCAATLETFLSKMPENISVDVVSKSRRLITRCLNRIAGQKEVTGPEVAAYLLGIKDCYTPYKFVTIHLDTFEYFLRKELAEDDEDTDETEQDAEKSNEERESFLVPRFGERMLAVNLRVDYQFRGQGLRRMCLFDYASTIQKIPITDKDLIMEAEQSTRDGSSRVDRFFFLGGDVACDEGCEHRNIHPQHRTHMQMHWMHGWEKVVVLAGKGVPKKDDIEKAEQYGTYILMLFKPWECVQDLRGCHETWASACQEFLADSSLSPRLRSIIDNIELLHRCAEETAIERSMREISRQDPRLEKARRIERSIPGYDATSEELAMVDNMDDSWPDDCNDGDAGIDPGKIVRAGLINSEMVDNAMQYLRLRGRMNILFNASTIGGSENEELDPFDDRNIRKSNSSDDRRVEGWKSTITSRKTTNKNYEDYITEPADAYVEPDQGNISMSIDLDANISDNGVDLLEETANEFRLNEEQRKAFFLVCDHCRRNHPYSPNKPSQLLMYLNGAGGTGKSRVIKAICKYFERIGKRDTLMILTYTGIAASNVSGSTIHSVCGLGFGEDGKRSKPLTGAALAEFQERWRKIEYIIIDEVSVVGQRLLARFHASLKLAKGIESNAPFAGMNILFAGDFMQLPPVHDQPLYAINKAARIATSKSGSTSARKNVGGIGPSAVTNAIGRELWLSVKHVIQLKQPMRQVDDPFYAEILDSMRRGKLSEIQRQALRERIVGDDRIATQEWMDAAFLVSRNQLRVQLNFDATREYAKNTDQYTIYSCAEDVYKRTPLNGRRRRRFLSVSDIKENPLCGILPLVIGMKIMLTVNICTNDGLANGVEGILRQIVFDEDAIDHTSSREKSIVLKGSPKYAVVELLDRMPGRYEDLPPKHIPVYPVKASCTYTVWTRDGTQLQYQFQRLQLPLTPAFAFTDYKCQGRTLQKAVVDLAEGSTSAGMYVMLSRVQRLSDLLILRPFNESLLDLKIPAALKEELRRLDACAKETERLDRWPDSM